jgi:hypothetical protein
MRRAVVDQLTLAERELRSAVDKMHTVLAESARVVNQIRLVREVPTVSIERIRAGIARDNLFVKP